MNELDGLNNENWESFVASLEDECRDFFLPNGNESPVIDQHQIDRDAASLNNNMNVALRGQVLANVRGTTSTNNTEGVDGEETPGVETSSPPAITPLQLWITQALNSIECQDGKPAALSKAYITAAIKIAKSLAEQMADTQNALMLQGNEVDLARHVRVHLGGNGQKSDDGTLESSLSNTDIRSVPDYLDIETAQVELSVESINGFKTDDPVIYQRQQLYCLGLVFYELFSGGQMPPSNIKSLASCRGAFASLSTLTLVKEKRDDDQSSGEADSNKRHQATSSPSDEDSGLCKISCDYLRLIGVKNAICSMILNMLECVYGECSGDDCYSQMVDVAHDLQLIESKPQKFLQDLNTNRLSLSGLPWDEINIPRDEELDAVKSCYRRCASGSWEAAIVKGESGSGKSWLARRVGLFVADEGGIFLSAKFDQMRQSRPLSAISSVFDQYCDVLIRERECADWANVTINNLQTALGQNAGPLIQVVPKLGHLLNARRSSFIIETDFITNDENSTNAAQRIRHLICKFLEVMSTGSDVPVALFFDDIQWADEASIDIMKLVLKFKNLFFLGCCRDDDMENTQPFSTILNDTNTFGASVIQVKLDGMSEHALNGVLSDLLCLFPRLVKSLSAIVFKKTQGNILFFHQLMMSIHRNGVLSLDFKNQRWCWDKEKLLHMELPDNIAKCFADGISKLPMEVQSALHTLAMFGASVKTDIIELLESKFKIEILRPLETATDGLVINDQGSFTFCHDRIQEASYNLVDEQNRCYNHLAYGKCLVKAATEGDNSDMLFLAVNQINLGCSSSVQIRGDIFTIVNYNVLAGKKAMLLSDFSLAYNFFDKAITFIDETHWNCHYEFCLEVHELASKSALATGNIRALPVLSSKILEKAKSFEDTLTTQLINMAVLAYSSKVSDAVEIGLSISAKLGEKVPAASQDTLNEEIQKVRAMITGLSEDQLLNLPMMTDTTKQMAMQFLVKLQTISYFLNSTLHTMVIIKSAQMTFLYGLSSASPLAFAAFGSYLGWIGSIKVGHRFASMGKCLLDSLDAADSAGEVIAVVTALRCYVEPVQAAKEMYVEGKAAAISSGDTNWAIINRALFCSTSLWSGTSLTTVNEIYKKAERFFRQHEHKMMLAFNLMGQHSISILLGKENEIMTIGSLSRSVGDNVTTPMVKMNVLFYQMYGSLTMGYGDLRTYCTSFLESKVEYSVLVFMHSCHTFVIGLASFKIYREARSSLWLKRGEKFTQDMRHWAVEGSSWNFEHKLKLMEAEEQFSIGDVKRAKESYTMAIELAQCRKFINDEALACELAAKFYFETGDLSSSLEHYRFAHEKYCEWGAVGKANQLFGLINETFAPHIER